MGCDWLSAGWSALADSLQAEGGLTATQSAQLMRLLGKRPKGAYPADDLVIDLRKHALAALLEGQDTISDDPDAKPPHPSDFGADPDLLGESPPIDEARIWLMGLIQAQRAELKELRDAVWQKTDGPDLVDAQDRILVDTGAKGVRLMRYENSAQTTFHRCLSQLIAIRKMEPDYQTISRLQNKGQHPSRVWVGTDWKLWSDYEAMMSGRDPHEAEADSRLEGVETVGSSDVEPAAPEDQAEAAYRGVEEAPSAPVMEPSIVTGWSGPGDPHPYGENQPIFGAAKHDAKKTSVDPQQGSRPGPETCHEGGLSEPSSGSDTGSTTTESCD
jgi:hypothetical protein